MKGKIFLTYEKEFNYYDYDISLCSTLNDGYVITINTNLDKDFNTLITQPTDLDESISHEIGIYENIDQNTEEIMTLLQKAKQNPRKYLEDAEYVEFNFSNEKVLEYLKKNPILKNKKIILKQSLDINDQPIEEIKELFSDYKDNLYFLLPDNDDYINFKEYEDTLTTLDKMAEEINQYDFSPIEKIMYAYDMIRSRIYKEVDVDENKSISRSLSSALLGDKIVCLGYIRIFRALLQKLGIESNEVLLESNIKNDSNNNTLSDDNTGHARCEIYVKDEKYGIDGVYYFEPTWNSKRDETDTIYLLSYKYFAKTRFEMDMFDKGTYINNKFPCCIKNLDTTTKKRLKENGIKILPNYIIKSINYMSKVIKNKKLINDRPVFGKQENYDIDTIIQEIEELTKYFNKPLTADTLLHVLYNVRKKQYYHKNNDYPFSIDDFYKIVIASNWNFKSNPEKKLSPEEKLCIAIFGENPNKFTKNKKSIFLEYVQENNLNKNIESVKLVKTLKKALNKKNQNT